MPQMSIMARPRICPSSSATRASSACSREYRLVTSFAAALMAEAHRPGESGAAQLVHLGIANTAGEVTDRDLVRGRIGDVDFLDHQRPSRLYLYGGLALHDRFLPL